MQRRPDCDHIYTLATDYTTGASAPCRLARCRSLTWLQRCRRVTCMPALKWDARATCSDKYTLALPSALCLNRQGIDFKATARPRRAAIVLLCTCSVWGLDLS
jgi:hypothetical protein